VRGNVVENIGVSPFISLCLSAADLSVSLLTDSLSVLHWCMRIHINLENSYRSVAAGV
tara:strand:+ start:41 stop:214 length:174 start_codon:yes stop_codon:yes gene_type:complete